MKLCEIVELSPATRQLDEVNIKQAIAGGAFALNALIPSHIAPSHLDVPSSQEINVSASRAEMDQAMWANRIMKKYKVSPKLATKVATLAQKYEKSSFPKAEDILAIVGIESSFIPSAVSNLKTDPAVGLMQVRPQVWELNSSRLSKDVEYQIKTGTEILHKYYKLLGNVEDAVHAYNVGIGNFRKGKHNIKYVHKYKNEKKMYRT